MRRATPAELRKSLEAVAVLKETGIDFMPVIVRDEAHRQQLIDSLFAELQAFIDEHTGVEK